MTDEEFLFRQDIAEKKKNRDRSVPSCSAQRVPSPVRLLKTEGERKNEFEYYNLSDESACQVERIPRLARRHLAGNPDVEMTVSWEANDD